MKIKTKKQLNLPQLIEWAWNNRVEDKDFMINETVGVHFRKHGMFKTRGMFTSDDLFTVEVEEEITEDTLIDKLIVVYSYCSDVDLYKCIKVGEFTNSNVKSIYILNDDYTTTLIWRDGKLVE